jgi:hypothetical protein
MRQWRLAEITSAIASLGSFLAAWGLWTHFAYTRPITPNALDGRVYSLDTHGWRVYLNAAEHFGLELLFVLALVLFVIAVVIDRLKKPFGDQR